MQVFLNLHLHSTENACKVDRRHGRGGGGYAPFAGIGDEWCCSILHVGHHFPEDFNERVTRACALEQGVAKDWCIAVQGDANIHCVPRELQLANLYHAEFDSPPSY